MNDDFERRLADLLGEQVDHELRDRGQAPPRRPADRAAHRPVARRAPWLMPLLAAACVAAIIAGGVGVSVLVSRRDSPAVPEPSVTTPVNPSPTLPPGTRQLDDADIAVPNGWQVTENEGNLPDTSLHEWCLHPSGVALGDCYLSIYHVAQYTTSSVMVAGNLMPGARGVIGDPTGANACNGDPPPTKATYTSSTFGGRRALRAEYVSPCHGTQLSHYVQYVATDAPMWWVILGRPSGPLPAGGAAALQHVVARSQLPAQDGSLPVVAVAEVKSSKALSTDAARVTVQEIVQSDESDSVVYRGATFSCDLGLVSAGKRRNAPKAGDGLLLRSDGHRITRWLKR